MSLATARLKTDSAMLSDSQESIVGAMPEQDCLQTGPQTQANPMGAGGVDLSELVPPCASEWWDQLPELVSRRVRLRELRPADAPSLADALRPDEVGAHLEPGPRSVAETEAFIAWSHRARAAGRHLCFGVTTPASDDTVGLFQLWPLEPTFRTAEWGFVLGRRWWGTGLFEAAARMMATFAFETVGVQRLEARSAVDNVRGNAALRKLGAVSEGVLRMGSLANGDGQDHVMWSILAEDRRAASRDRIRQITGDLG